MRPTFMGFEMATRSLSAIQKAQDIVGNNIGNIGVTGYTRQRVDMVSLATNNRYTRYAQKGATLEGQGAMAYGVAQVRDPFLDKRFREEYCDVGYYNKLKEVLTDLDDGLTEIAPSTMTTALSKLQSAWNEMVNRPDSVASSSALATTRTLTQVFQQLSKKIDDVWEQQKYDLNVNANSVNSLLERIANLNDTIQKEVFSAATPGNENYGPNELMDQRNVLLDQLAEFGDITYKTNADGTVDVKMGRDGHPVVTGSKFEQVFVSQQEGQQSVSLRWQSTGAEADMISGSFRASLDMLNGRGPQGANVQRGENFEKGILYYKDKIDIFAQTMAEAFNNTIPVYDANGTRLGYKKIFTFTGNGDETAANLDVSTEWASDPSYILKDVQLPEEGVDDNEFAANIKALFTKSHHFGEFEGTFSDYISFYTNANLGNQLEFADSRLTAVSDISNSLLNKISEISGVSMEEEGVDMMQYQKAFQAMSRVMTAFDEMLDTLINRTGLVGR